MTEPIEAPIDCIHRIGTGTGICDECLKSMAADIAKPGPISSAEFTGCMTDVIGNAKKKGAIDFVKGVKVGDNPYLDHDARHWAWMEGWAGAGLAAH